MSGLPSNSISGSGTGNQGDLGVKPEGPKSQASPDDINDYFSLGNEGDDKDDKVDKDDKEDKTPVRRAKPVKEDKEDKELDNDDDDDIKLKEAEDEDEKLDLEEKKSKEGDDELEIDAPPRKKEVTAKYPNFFKEFPFFEKMMFRDRQYTELFGSFDDAKEVAERAQVLDSFEADLMRGSTESVLAEVKRLDKKAFDRIVDGYLTTLAKVDKEAYFEVSGNVTKQLIKEMVQEARGLYNNGNKEAAESLNAAAQLINQFMFGTTNYTPVKPRVEVNNDAEEQINRERQDMVRERYDIARADLQTRVDNTLRATITDYIDRKGEMSDYVKRNAVRDALVMLHKTIGEDANFRRNLDRLWEASFNQRLNKNSLDRIRSAYLGKSRQLLPAIIKKARAEALNGQAPSSRKERDDDNEQEETPRRRGPISDGRPRQHSGGNRGKMEKGESVLEFFSRD